jgi:hypothetical protein
MKSTKNVGIRKAALVAAVTTTTSLLAVAAGVCFSFRVRQY